MLIANEIKLRLNYFTEACTYLQLTLTSSYSIRGGDRTKTCHNFVTSDDSPNSLIRITFK